MPELNLPIQGYDDPIVGNTDYALPVAQSIPQNIPRVYVDSPGIENRQEQQPILKPVDYNPFEKLLGLNGAERYKTWPEKLITSGITAAGDALSGKIPQYEVDPVSGDVHTSPQMLERALDMASMAGTGGLAGTTDATLGSAPFLRSALKYKDKLYKGKEGQQHMDVIPEALYPEFQKMAMSGEDISHYNFGFHNDKGQFLSREKALEYGINTGLIDPQAGKFGALTSTLMADSSKPGVAIEAVAKAEPFFSALEHNVSQIKQSKMTGDQWLGTLNNKPGVKPEELDWTGLKSFLEENKGKAVTKGQIEEHLANNKVELKEVSKGISSDPYFHYMRDSGIAHELHTAEDIALAKTHNANFRETFKGMSDEEILKLAKEAEAAKGIGDTKYHSYQLPGGENYREMLLTLPEKPKLTADGLPHDYQLINENAEAAKLGFKIPEGTPERWSFKGPNISSQIFKTREDAVNAALRNAKQEEHAGAYKSSHWDEPNILAHVRMNDRTIEGKKSLHLEEIQSDWHQQGRDKGYTISKADEIKAKARIDELLAKDKNEISPQEKIEFNTLMDKVAHNGVPDAPFKKSWHELALKRMIREAAEKGYDRLSWTPGEAQAARYDLSKQVSKISYNPNTGYNKILDIKGNDISTGPISKEKLANTIGKEAAEKLLNSKPNDLGIHSLAGDGLKIGGEGMKGFYDQIIPKALEKLGKEHGVKVKQAPIEHLEGNSAWNKINPAPMVHYIDIPKSLKDTAMHKGFPLFSSGIPIPLMPIDHDPWKFTPVEGNPFEKDKKK